MSSSSKIEISTELLRTLHRIHRQRTDLKSRIDRGPRQVKAGEAMVAKSLEAVTEAQSKLKKARMAADEKELQLQSRELRIDDLKTKLNMAASNREFSLLKEQIAADEKANSVLSDEILEWLERIDSLEKSLNECEQELAKQQAEQAQRVVDVQQKNEMLLGELARVEAELEQAEQQLPLAMKAEYKRITAAKGEDSLAPTDGDSCGGCFQTLTTQIMSTLKLSQLVRCPNCNAYLYLPEDRRVR